MADGEYDSPIDALRRMVMEIGIRMGGAEKDIQQRVTGERMLTVFNELQRSYTAEVREVKGDVRQMLETQDTRNDKRFADMQGHLERNNKSSIREAVQEAIEAERKRDADARKDVEEKARQAVLGISLLMKGGWAVVGGAIAIVGLFFLKMTLGWSPFG